MQGEHPFLFSIVTYRHPRAFNRAIIRPAPFESPECAVNHIFSRWIWRRLNISENLGECSAFYRPSTSLSISFRIAAFRRFWYPRLQLSCQRRLLEYSSCMSARTSSCLHFLMPSSRKHEIEQRREYALWTLCVVDSIPSLATLSSN
jgi:hypothetical protein